MNYFIKIWNYGTKTPFQRVGVLFLVLGLVSAFSWLIKSNLDFEDLIDPYYVPEGRDSFIFHLYLYFIPLGVLMSWGYVTLLYVKSWVFNQEVGTTKSKKMLDFKDSKSAFEFASNTLSKSFYKDTLSVGIITSKLTSDTNNPIFIVRLADEQRVIVAGINDRYSNYLGVGHLIYWGYVDRVNYEIMPEVQAIGHIVATLENCFDPTLKKWKVLKDLT